MTQRASKKRAAPKAALRKKRLKKNKTASRSRTSDASEKTNDVGENPKVYSFMQSPLSSPASPPKKKKKKKKDKETKTSSDSTFYQSSLGLDSLIEMGELSAKNDSGDELDSLLNEIADIDSKKTLRAQYDYMNARNYFDKIC